MPADRDCGMETAVVAKNEPARTCCHPLSSPLTRDEATELAGVLRALADPARLQIVALINSSPEGEVCACDLVEPLGLSQPTVSHHLKVLNRAGVLTRQQRGNWAFYSVCCDLLDEIASSIRHQRTLGSRTLGT